MYGEEPPPIGGIAIMTDSGDTGESARAWFGDILFKNAGGEASDTSYIAFLPLNNPICSPCVRSPAAGASG